MGTMPLTVTHLSNEASPTQPGSGTNQRNRCLAQTRFQMGKVKVSSEIYQSHKIARLRSVQSLQKFQ